MLVLSRKIGERIMLPEQNITLVVVDVHGNRVRLGIEAPPDVTILREELVGQELKKTARSQPA